MRKTVSNEDIRGRNPLEKVGPQLILEEQPLFCDECKGMMTMREKRYCCLDCSAIVLKKNNTFDVCDRCVAVTMISFLALVFVCDRFLFQRRTEKDFQAEGFVFYFYFKIFYLALFGVYFCLCLCFGIKFENFRILIVFLYLFVC